MTRLDASGGDSAAEIGRRRNVLPKPRRMPCQAIVDLASDGESDMRRHRAPRGRKRRTLDPMARRSDVSADPPGSIDTLEGRPILWTDEAGVRTAARAPISFQIARWCCGPSAIVIFQRMTQLI